MNGAVLHHTAFGRSTATIAALAGSTCLLAIAIVGGAAWWFYPPVVFAAFGSAYMVLRNPQSGATIDAGQFRVYSGNWSHTLDVADIASISIVEWSEGAPTVTANLKDGSSFTIPSACLPGKQALADAARQCGIALT